jgi:hypothetical protein
VHQSAQLKKVTVSDKEPVVLQPAVELAGQELLPGALARRCAHRHVRDRCEAHSLTVTTRTFGYAGRPELSAAVLANPNAAAFSGVSGASHSNPSMAMSRQGPRNAPAVNSSATGAATSANSCFMGSYPSRWRAWVIPPDVGTPHESCHQPHAVSVWVSRAATPS